MNAAQRLAGQVLSQGNVLDAGVSAAQAGLVAAAQIAAGIDPGEAGWAALAGLGLGVVSSQPMAAMGRSIGRVMDRRGMQVPQLLTAGLPGSMNHFGDLAARGKLNTPQGRHSQALFEANYFDAQGRSRGRAETDMSAIGRAYGDDAVRLAAQIAVPGLIADQASSESTTPLSS